MNRAAGGTFPASRQPTAPPSRQNCWTQIRRKVSTAGTCRSQTGAFAEWQAEEQRAVREGGAGDAGSLVGTIVRDGRAERHGVGLANRRIGTNTAEDHPDPALPDFASRITNAGEPVSHRRLQHSSGL